MTDNLLLDSSFSFVMCIRVLFLILDNISIRGFLLVLGVDNSKQVSPNYFTIGFVGSVGPAHSLPRRWAGWHPTWQHNTTSIICRRFEYEFALVPDQLRLIPLFQDVLPFFSFGAGKERSRWALKIFIMQDTRNTGWPLRNAL